MNSSRVLYVLCVCFWCFTRILSDQLEPNFSTINQQLIAEGSNYYENYLEVALVAASTGKNIFRMPRSLSEECVRTAKALMISLAKPSTWPKAKKIASISLTLIMGSAQMEPNSVEVLCNYIDEMVNETRSDFPDFEQLKKNVRLPNHTKNYFLEIPTDRSARQALTEWVSKYKDEAFLRYTTVAYFQDLENADTNPSQQFVARAIRQLSASDTFKSTVDRVFTLALDDYVKDLLVKTANTNEDTVAFVYDSSFAKKVDEYFSQNAVIKETYERIKKKANDDANNTQ